MKLAICYSVWTGDDMEMLKRSIEHHLPFVDKVIICWQEVSNKGEKGYGNIPCFIGSQIVKYTPNLNLNTKQNERIKHNTMIEVSKHLGCTHFILAAGDHFYSDEMFYYGKMIMQENDVDVILTRMRTYYKHENWILDPLESYYMPFIHKCTINTQITSQVKYPVVVDPSVKVNAKTFHISSDKYLMDHYSMVRNDIEKKLRNAAASIRWTPEQIKQFIDEYNNAKPGDKISYFQGRKIVEVEK